MQCNYIPIVALHVFFNVIFPSNMKKFCLKDRLHSFKYAFQGIRLCLFNEHNAWIHCSLASLVIIAGSFFPLTSIEWCILILCIGIVIAAEITNTAIEYIVNFISPELHPIAGKIKDLAAGAVLVTAITSAIVGLIIFGPHFLNLLFV